MMGSYEALAFRLFSSASENLMKYFPDVKKDLKVADTGYSLQEYISMSILTSVIVFIIQLPLLSFAFGTFFHSFLFSFIFSITISSATTVLTFFVILNYPKTIIKQKSKQIENSLPFATLYLSTVAGSNLPTHKIFEIFSKFATYGEMKKQINEINEDVKIFGIDINTALERAVERSPSKKLKELIYGMLSTIRSGANLPIFLKEKSSNFMADYRRTLYEFSHNLTMYLEIYITSIVIGAMFFTILTAIISGITGTASNIVTLQFFLVFVFLPLISTIFIFLVKSIAPGGE